MRGGLNSLGDSARPRPTQLAAKQTNEQNKIADKLTDDIDFLVGFVHLECPFFFG